MTLDELKHAERLRAELDNLRQLLLWKNDTRSDGAFRVTTVETNYDIGAKHGTLMHAAIIKGLADTAVSLFNALECLGVVLGERERAFYLGDGE